MKSVPVVLFAVIVLATVIFSEVVAQMPKTLNYQGTLATGSTPVPDGNYSVTFRLYAAVTGGSAVWTEAQLVQARNGVFNAILGKIVPLPSSFNTSYWLSLQVGADPELSPRLEMTGVSYSMHSLKADSAQSVSKASITSDAIADGAIESRHVALNSLLAADILDEPGVSRSVGGGTGFSGVIGSYTVDSVDIELPAPGHVLLIGTGYVNLWHTTGTNTQVWVAVNTVPNSAEVLAPSSIYAYLRSDHPTDLHTVPFTSIMVVTESSGGPKRYYLNARFQSGANMNTNIAHPSVTALYFPTLMGTTE